MHIAREFAKLVRSERARVERPAAAGARSRGAAAAGCDSASNGTVAGWPRARALQWPRGPHQARAAAAALQGPCCAVHGIRGSA